MTEDMKDIVQLMLTVENLEWVGDALEFCHVNSHGKDVITMWTYDGQLLGWCNLHRRPGELGASLLYPHPPEEIA